MNLEPSSYSVGFSSLGLFLGLLLHGTEGRELTFVLTVFRHGDRTPIQSFPTNTVKQDVWPQGYGQLTKTGIQQQYELGQYLKYRYHNFLSTPYDPKEIYVQSTYFNRTILSAQATLGGLFCPCESENPPIPVYTVPLSMDNLLIYPNFRCRRFKQIIQNLQKRPTFQSKLEPYMPFLIKLAGHLGYKLKELLDFKNNLFWNAYDTLKVQQIHNHPLPEWADTQTMYQMKEMLKFIVKIGFGGERRIEKSRIQGGVLVKDILENMVRSTQSQNRRKMIMYSAHDLTIIALQIALDVFDQELPVYSACHFFELYKEDSGDYSVEMYYRNNPAEEPNPLLLPGCSKACPLEKFKELVTPIMPENLKEECKRWKVKKGRKP